MEKKIEGQAAEMEQRALSESAVGAEVVEKREECAKHYHLGGNRYQAVLFAEPVHFHAEGEKGWQEYDNNLEEVEDARGRKVLRNKANPLRVELPEQANGEALLRLTHKGRTLSWKFAQPVNAVRARVKQGADLKLEKLVQRAQKAAKFVGRTPGSLRAMDLEELEQETMTAQERRADLTSRQARAEYADVLPGVSVVYHLEGAKVKEDIVLANAAALEKAELILPDEYDYTVNDDQSVSVQDKATAEELFHFEPPVVYDSAEAPRRTLANVALTPEVGGMRLRYQIDADFLADAAFPVIIDPVVFSKPKHNGEIKDVAVSQQRVQDDLYLPLGKVTNSSFGTVGEEYVALLKQDKLIKLGSSDTLVKANLCLTSAQYSSGDFIEVFGLRQRWDKSTVNWNWVTQNSDPEALDCAPTGAVVTLDITSLYRDWYQSSLNMGLVLRKARGGTNAAQTFYASDVSTASNRPYFAIYYVSHAGLASWCQYESQSAGRAGTASVDLFNGNLTYAHADASVPSNKTPIALSHYYNSCLSADNDYQCGYGWKLSAHQTVRLQEKYTDNQKDYYVWTDGSGTEHFFMKSGSSPYDDEEGMKLKLREHNAVSKGFEYLSVTNQQGYRMRFKRFDNGSTTNPYWLYEAEDALGNKVNYTYATVNGYKVLSKISAGDPHTLTLNYDANGMLQQVIEPGSGNTTRTVTYGYDGGRLTSIQYSDLGGLGTTFTYTSKVLNSDGSDTSYPGRLLIGAQNFDGQKINISYDGAVDYRSIEELTKIGAPDQMRRVTALEQVSGSAYGSKRTIAYRALETDVTVQEGAAPSTALDKTVTYQFNDGGNVVCVKDEMGAARFTKFSSDIPNSPTAGSRLQKAVVNKLPGFTGDASTTWSQTANGGTIALSTSATGRCLGTLQLVMSRTSAASSDANGSKYTSERITLPAGKWTLSAYMQVKGVTSGSSFCRVNLISGSLAQGSATQSRKISGTTDENAGALATKGWERYGFTFTTAQASVIEVELVHAGNGEARFACPQLEEGAVMNRVNLVDNGDFTYTTTSGGHTLPMYWTVGTGLASGDNYGVIAPSDDQLPAGVKGNILTLESNPTKDHAEFTSEYNVYGAKGDIFTLGGWAKAKASAQRSGVGSVFALRLQFYDRSKKAWDTNIKDVEFNRAHVDWQFACGAVKAVCDYSKVRVRCSYTKNINSVQFTNVFLHREAFGKSFAYNPTTKNLETMTGMMEQQLKIEYDDADNVKYYTPLGRTNETNIRYTMDYGSSADERKKHLLKSMVAPSEYREAYSYDGYGNQTRRILRKTSTAATVILTEAEYGTDGHYKTKDLDERMIETSYARDANSGLLTSVTRDNKTVNYEYDASKRIRKVSANGSAGLSVNEYAYANDRLQTVQHNTTSDASDVVYQFTYDEFGNQKSVTVGGQTLSTNRYASGRVKRLEEVTYGNGGKVAYDYDAYDRMTAVRYDGANSARYEYEYGANGRVARVKDANLNRELETQYDLAERPMQVEQRDANGNVLYGTTLKYNKCNVLERFSENVNGTKYETTYTNDKDPRPKEVQFGDATRKVTYNYDSVGRINDVAITNGASRSEHIYFTAATARGSGFTSHLVSKITNATKSEQTFEYAYDAMGNVTSEKHNNVEKTYAYDGLGQLLRANDPEDKTMGSSGTTWVYSYDRGGNIAGKTAYGYTTAATPSGASTSYGYAYNTAWKDKLTSYNGNTIGYDAIGNPTSYGGWTYTWQAGRQLRQMKKSDGTTLTYDYDANGLRVRKTESGVGSTEYTLHGKLVTHVKKGSEQLHIFYTESGRPMLLEYTNASGSKANYTYMHNMQGDIVGIVDNGNNLVVEYKYDAWGKPVSTWTLTTAYQALASLNPLRYRGYVYDEETGLYYLRSRYYNPEWGRFINADSNLGSLGALGTHNAYAYCGNNPVCYNDPNGQSFLGDTLERISNAINEIYNQVVEFTKRYQAAQAAAKKINDTIGKDIISQEEVTMAALFPIPARVMGTINDNIHANSQTILLSYWSWGTAFIVYSENEYGAIYKRDYAYRTAKLQGIGENPLYNAIDTFTMFADDPASSGVFPNWYSYVGYLWGEAKKWESIPYLEPKSVQRLYWGDDPWKDHIYLFS